jgi:hypothetical protein
MSNYPFREYVYSISLCVDLILMNDDPFGVIDDPFGAINDPIWLYLDLILTSPYPYSLSV